jgi:AcrR family transcriptional regulator
VPQESGDRRAASGRGKSTDGFQLAIEISSVTGSRKKQRAPAATRGPKLSRAEKHEQIRKALLHAAAKVVGAEGYSAAMVSTITARAGVAQGTFYNYFNSRQDLFDQLLPGLTGEMLDFIQAKSAGQVNDVERERKGFKAFFQFLLLKPEFYRILYESELFAPEAYRRHLVVVAEGYTRVLRRAGAAGELKPYNPRELEAIAFILMGSREYLCMRYARSDGEIVDLPDFVIEAYMKLVTGGLWKPSAGRRRK